MAGNKSKKTLVKKADEAVMPISIEDVQDKIIVLRGEPVILDRDVAALYGVQTKEINQAVKNNPGKFPIGYLFTLDHQDIADLLTTSSEGTENEEVAPIFSKSRYAPTAFTERGLYMMGEWKVISPKWPKMIQELMVHNLTKWTKWTSKFYRLI